MLDALFFLVQAQNRLFAHCKFCSWCLSQQKSCFSVWAHRFLCSDVLPGECTDHRWLLGTSALWSGFHCIKTSSSRRCWSSPKAGELSVTRDSPLTHAASNPLAEALNPGSWTSEFWDVPGGGTVIVGWKRRNRGKLSLWSHGSWRARLISHKVDVTVPWSSKCAREWLDTDQCILFWQNSNWGHKLQ